MNKIEKNHFLFN